MCVCVCDNEIGIRFAKLLIFVISALQWLFYFRIKNAKYRWVCLGKIKSGGLAFPLAAIV